MAKFCPLGLYAHQSERQGKFCHDPVKTMEC